MCSSDLELLAAQQRLTTQARAMGEDARLRQRLANIGQELQALPAATEEAAAAGQGDLADPERLQARLDGLELDLRDARGRHDQAQAALQAQQSQLQQASQALEAQRRAIQNLEQELREQQNQSLEARTRREALLQRHGSEAALQTAITEIGRAHV